MWLSVAKFNSFWCTGTLYAGISMNCTRLSLGQLEESKEPLQREHYFRPHSHPCASNF